MDPWPLWTLSGSLIKNMSKFLREKISEEYQSITQKVFAQNPERFPQDASCLYIIFAHVPTIPPCWTQNIPKLYIYGIQDGQLPPTNSSTMWQLFFGCRWGLESRPWVLSRFLHFLAFSGPMRCCWVDLFAYALMARTTKTMAQYTFFRAKIMSDLGRQATDV
jgi:hypothetical protein